MEALTTLLALLFFGFIGIVLLVIAAKTIRIVPQATVMLVERLGRFDKVASSGQGRSIGQTPGQASPPLICANNTSICRRSRLSLATT
jgi:hypothetical protein